MKPFLKILEEMSRNQWAILPNSLRAMLAVLDGEELSADDYKLFHQVSAEKKEAIRMAEAFGAPVTDTLYSYRDGNTGYLLIDGPLIPRATAFSDVSGLVSMDRLTSEFKALEVDPTVQTIVFLFDTPGGAVAGVSDFARLVKASEKETIGFAWMAASAGYWIATAVDTLVAPDTGIVGSIGTVLAFRDYSEADAKRGIQNIEIVSSQSPNKRADVKTPEGKAVYQRLVDDLAAVFIGAVAENRGVTEDEVLERFGAGAMVVAGRAVEAGMIDEVSDLETITGRLRGNPAALRGFSLSASTAAQPQEEAMAEPKTKTFTAEELEAAKKEAHAAGFTAGVEAEAARVQAIEGLADKVKNGLPAVKAAVQKTINAEKWKPEATEASVSALLLDTVSTAQSGSLEDFGNGRRASAELAGHTSTATPTTTREEGDEEESKGRVNALIAARDRRQGKPAE